MGRSLSKFSVLHFAVTCDWCSKSNEHVPYAPDIKTYLRPCFPLRTSQSNSLTTTVMKTTTKTTNLKQQFVSEGAFLVSARPTAHSFIEGRVPDDG